MAYIIVADDDPGTLKVLSVVLSSQGHKVCTAASGDALWALVQQEPPELLVSDVNMPGLSGFEVLECVRKHPRYTHTPVILLTSLQDRQDLRHGMRMGADDFLTKPFEGRDLLDAVSAQLNKQALRHASQRLQLRSVVTEALEQQARMLGNDFEDRLAAALNEQWPSANTMRTSDEQVNATVLAVRIWRHAEWARALKPNELGHWLKRFHESTGDTAFLFGANLMQFLGDGVVALFNETAAGPAAPPALRALKAAMGIKKAALTMRAQMGKLLAEHPGLPAAELGIVLHSGPVGLMRLEGLLGGAAHTVPVGQTVSDALAVLDAVATPRTTVTLTAPVLRRVTGAVVTGPRRMVQLAHSEQLVDVCEAETLTPHEA